MNYVTFVAGQAQGSGFGEWYFDHTGNAGSFLADSPANMNVGTSKGFGLWANGGGRAAITRAFTTPMKSGDSFNVKFDNNWMDDGAQVGLELRDANGTARFRFFFIGGESNYRVVDTEASRATSIAYTENGLNLTLTLGAGNTYTFNTGAGEFSGTLAAGDPIAWVQFFNQNAGPNTERNVYVGAMSHTVATTGERTVTTTATITRNPPDGPYGDWLGGASASDQTLLDYAVGGGSGPGEEGEPMDISRDETHLLMTAVVRTGDPSVVVGVEAASDLLGTWLDEGIEMVDADDQTNLPAGCVRKVIRVPMDSDRKFVRFKVTHTP
jgi:hypothetical protein